MCNIVDALYKLKIPVFMVTHLFEFIQEMYQISEKEFQKKINLGIMLFAFY